MTSNILPWSSARGKPIFPHMCSGPWWPNHMVVRHSLKPVLRGRQSDHECQLLYRKGGLVGGLVSAHTLCCAADNKPHPPLNPVHTRLSHKGTAHAVRWPGHVHGGGLYSNLFFLQSKSPIIPFGVVDLCKFWLTNRAIPILSFGAGDTGHSH